jgi:hypothetical protein
MLSSALTHDYGMEREREGSLNFVFIGDGRVEHKKERDQMSWGKLSQETGT